MGSTPTEPGHGFCFRGWICAFWRHQVFPSACSWEGFLPLLRVLQAGSPGAGLWRRREVSRCHLSASISTMRRGRAAAAQPTSAHPQRNLFSTPWAACLIRGFVKHSAVPGVLWFGPGGVKGQEKRGCCWRVRHRHFPGCSARVCRHKALHHL